MHIAGALAGQKKVWDPLELELGDGCEPLCEDCEETKPSSSVRASHQTNRTLVDLVSN